MNSDVKPVILLVEDDDMSRDMLSRRLISRGFQVIVAEDGEKALKAVTQNSINLVLMDLSLPIIDGTQAMQKIKADPRTEKLPIVALTAHAMAGVHQEAILAGFDAYSTKPVNLDELLKIISRLLKSQPA